MVIKIVFDCYVISFLCSLIFRLLFFGNHYGGKYVLGWGGRTKMAIRSRGGGAGRGVGHYHLAGWVAQRM